MAKKTKLLWGISIVGILLATAGWAFYELINNGLNDFLAMFGITNLYIQNLIIILVILLIVVLIFKKGLPSSLKKLTS